MNDSAPRLGPHEHVVTAYAAPASGPGWANSPVIVIIRDGNGKLREQYLQPQHMDEVMHTLYHVSSAVNGLMKNAAEKVMAPPKRGSAISGRP